MSVRVSPLEHLRKIPPAQHRNPPIHRQLLAHDRPALGVRHETWRNRIRNHPLRSPFHRQRALVTVVGVIAISLLFSFPEPIFPFLFHLYYGYGGALLQAGVECRVFVDWV